MHSLKTLTTPTMFQNDGNKIVRGVELTKYPTLPLRLGTDGPRGGVSNGLDPDQDRRSVGPDLGSNHSVNRLSADDKSRRQHGNS